jgi:hypothetical protein
MQAFTSTKTGTASPLSQKEGHPKKDPLDALLAPPSSRDVSPLTPILAVPPRKVVEYLAAYPARPVLLGSGLSRNISIWEELRAQMPGNALFLPPAFDLPREEILLHSAAGLNYTAQDLVPLYVRSSDAEENLEQISASLGLDPQAAVRRLKDLTGG